MTRAEAIAYRTAIEKARSAVTDNNDRLAISVLYAAWVAGNHTKGEIYTANNQVWECFQSYDNAVHPDIKPSNAAWYTFNRPLHGTTPETARDFVQPTGAHDMYHVGEYAIFNEKLYHCITDTAHSPADYAAAWELIEYE